MWGFLFNTKTLMHFMKGDGIMKFCLNQEDQTEFYDEIREYYLHTQNLNSFSSLIEFFKLRTDTFLSIFYLVP